jgi:ABC-type sugar transport system ATPase subunit
MSNVSLRKVSKSYGPLDIVKAVDLDIKAGELVVFVGPSGCGKSTLLRMISGLEDLNGGEIWIGDKRADPIPPAKRDIAMVFQSYALYPHMTVAENIGFSLKLAGVPKSDITRRVEDVAVLLRLDDLLERKPGQLSGGQRQRVAIGRALVRDPKIVLLDEPLSNLDAALRVEMRIELARLHRKLGATMIYVTHDQMEAMTLADRVVVLKDGQIEQVGTPMELYSKPANAFVAQFVGSPKMNLFPARICSENNEVCLGGRVRFDAPAVSEDADIVVGLRPEHMAIVKDATPALSGHVTAVEQTGADTYVYFDAEMNTPAVARLPGMTSINIGDNVRFTVPQDACHLFSTAGKRLNTAPPD